MMTPALSSPVETDPPRLRAPRVAARVGSVLLLVSSALVGLWSLRYLAPHPPAVPALESFTLHRPFFILHAIFASIALLLGPLQFRNRGVRSGRRHRISGRVYAGAVLVAWIFSVPIALSAHTGRFASLGFLFLGTSWTVCTAVGVFAARQRLFAQHREWMMRSFALTAAAITLRLYIGVSQASSIPLAASYAWIAWLCWVPNVLFAEWLIRRGRRGPPSFASHRSTTATSLRDRSR